MEQFRNIERLLKYTMERDYKLTVVFSENGEIELYLLENPFRSIELTSDEEVDELLEDEEPEVPPASVLGPKELKELLDVLSTTSTRKTQTDITLCASPKGGICDSCARNPYNARGSSPYSSMAYFQGGPDECEYYLPPA